MNDLQTPSATDGYKLSDALSLFSAQTACMYQLWAFYTATVLGSIVFGLSNQQNVFSATVFLSGYFFFAIGELVLLSQTMKLIAAVKIYLREQKAGSDNALDRVLSRIVDVKNPVWISVLIQIIGSLCVATLVIANVCGLIPHTSR